MSYIKYLLLFSVVFLFNCSKSISDVRITSPNNSIVCELKCDETGTLAYSVQVFQDTLIRTSQLGFQTSIGGLDKFQILKVHKNKIDKTWQPVYGERSLVRDFYNSAFVEMQSLDEPALRVNLNCRVYNEGVAFRYEFPEQQNSDSLFIEKELTEFSFTDDFPVWATYRAQAEYHNVPLNEVENGCERPLVVHANETMAAIGEAALIDYARMKFDPHPDKEFTLVSGLDNPVQTKLPFVTPWRFIMVGENPGQLLENNYFILNLNEPNKIKDTSWIKPGKVIREVTLTTLGGKACIDFAVEHNLQYVEFDAGWYGNEYDDNSDATTVTVDPNRSPGPLNLHEVIQYGKERGIGIILYVNRRALEKQLDVVLPLFEDWGIAGVKYGFVQVGPQQWTSWLHDAVRKAAKYKLMIDVHDEYRPTGYSRTYPNFMTQEGIRGDEESPTNEHTLITMFTRMIAGAGDNTICYFADRVQNKMGSHASQLAKAVCLYSPWQFLYWYDRPQGSPGKKGGAGSVQNFITNEPELEFFNHVPTVWDETKVLEADISHFGTIARRSGEDWYIGCINGQTARTFTIDLGFLKPNQKYIAHIYADDASLNTRTNVRLDRYLVSSETVIREEILANNGLAMRIVPTQEDAGFPDYGK